MKTLVHILLALIGLSLMAPLVYWFGVFGIPLWSLPFSALLFIQLGMAAARKKHTFRGLDFFEWNVVVFGVAMTASTLLNPSEVTLGNNKLFVFILALGLAVYVKRNFGRTVTMQHLVVFAYLLIVIQFVVCSAQLVLQRPIGNVGAYFGSTQSTQVGGGAIGGLLGVVRPVGTLGGSPNLVGRVVVVCLPFVVGGDSVFPRLNRKAGVLFRRVVIAMAVVTVVMTLSRSSMGVLLLLALSAGLWRLGQIIRSEEHRVFSRGTLTGLVASFAVALLVVWFTGSKVQNLAGNVIKAVQLRASTIGVKDGPLARRYRQVKGAVELFADSPVVLGKGYRSTMGVTKKTSVKRTVGHRVRVHNAYFQFLAEGGVFSFISFVVITIYPIFLYLVGKEQYDKEDYIFIAATFSIIIFTQTSTTYDSSILSPIYMIMIGGAIGNFMGD